MADSNRSTSSSTTSDTSTASDSSSASEPSSTTKAGDLVRIGDNVGLVVEVIDNDQGVYYDLAYLTNRQTVQVSSKEGS